MLFRFTLTFQLLISFVRPLFSLIVSKSHL